MQLTKRRLSYSVGFGLTATHAVAIDLVPDQAWTPAYDGDGQVRDRAWLHQVHRHARSIVLAEGIRLIIRKERPHPGA